MKKMITLALAITCVLGLLGCSSDSIDKTKPVFEIENINRIIFYSTSKADEGIEVPNEYVAEIKTWLGSFTIDEKADGDALAPGSNSISVRIEYSDGTIVDNGLSTTTIDGVTYYMKHNDAPECYFEIFSEINPAK